MSYFNVPWHYICWLPEKYLHLYCARSVTGHLCITSSTVSAEARCSFCPLLSQLTYAGLFGVWDITESKKCETRRYTSAVVTVKYSSDCDFGVLFRWLYFARTHTSDNMSSVHYKFKSNNEFKTLTFDGVSISIADLRKEIIQKSKMGKLKDDFHLQITNPQTGEGTAVVSSCVIYNSKLELNSLSLITWYGDCAYFLFLIQVCSLRYRVVKLDFSCNLDRTRSVHHHFGTGMDDFGTVFRPFRYVKVIVKRLRMVFWQQYAWSWHVISNERTAKHQMPSVRSYASTQSDQSAIITPPSPYATDTVHTDDKWFLWLWTQ